ncbi:MAG: hypothetical protein ACRCXV_03955, partial [Bacteroidales bacterium]
ADLWDEALSSGHASFIVANDDSHNINKLYQLARNVTFVNVNSTKYTDLTDALKRGSTYGLKVPNFGDGDWEIKKAKNDSLPKPLNIAFSDDTLRLRLDQIADSIRIIGQGGTPKLVVKDTTYIEYVIQPEDTYIRAEARFSNGVDMYFNPLFRYSNDQPLAYQELAHYSFIKTLLYSFVWLIAILVQLVLLYKVIVFPLNSKRR